MIQNQKPTPYPDCSFLCCCRTTVNSTFKHTGWLIGLFIVNMVSIILRPSVTQLSKVCVLLYFPVWSFWPMASRILRVFSLCCLVLVLFCLRYIFNNPTTEILQHQVQFGPSRESNIIINDVITEDIMPPYFNFTRQDMEPQFDIYFKVRSFTL